MSPSVFPHFERLAFCAFQHARTTCNSKNWARAAVHGPAPECPQRVESGHTALSVEVPMARYPKSRQWTPKTVRQTLAPRRGFAAYSRLKTGGRAMKSYLLRGLSLAVFV